tara:strand:+ start:2948 stop:3742 length:795 start_codon:yes stop_codon:yes gene_type:complete
MFIRLNELILILFVLSLDSFAYAHGMSEAEKQTIMGGDYLQFLKAGVTHMITGYDHLLFLFGIVLYYNRFFDVIKYVTAFTVGHSITLITATLAKIILNFYLIDALIALSVCYIGYDNIVGFRKIFNKPTNLIIVVFLFGLIHGFGLSTILQQFPLGESTIVFKIIYFNLGVELGQIVALFIMVSFLIKLRNTDTFPQIRITANYILIFFGFMLFIMHMHGYLHNTYPDDFMLSEDNHFHVHEKMSPNIKIPENEYMVLPEDNS